MPRASIKSAALEQYSKLTLTEIETLIKDLENKHKTSPNSTNTQDLTIARYALQQHQRSVKAAAMQFEATNNHHLLFFDSTNNFIKLAGHSALFFATTIADRIHWRYSLKADTDRYSPSEDGVISFRSMDKIHDRLAEINIFPDPLLNAPEFHYYKLSKVYTDEQIAKLRDNARRDLERIVSIVLPNSPMPSLHDAIVQSSQIIYYEFKHLSDSLARDTLGQRAILATYKMSDEYIRYAHSDNTAGAEHLCRIVELARELKNILAYASRIGILHHREICKALDYLVAVERIAGKALSRKGRS